MVDDAATFDTAWVQTLDGGHFLFNVDRIVVPEPALSLELAIGVATLCVCRRRRDDGSFVGEDTGHRGRRR